MPEPHKYKQYLDDIADYTQKRLPDNHGFIVLVAPYSDDDSIKTINCVSNIQRESAMEPLTTV